MRERPPATRLFGDCEQRSQTLARASSLARRLSIAGLATAPAVGVAITLSHIWLIAGVAAAISLASALRASGESFAAREETSFNCAIASLILGKAACAPASSVMVGSADFRILIDELTWFAKFTPSTVRSEGAMPTVPATVRAGTSATVC